VVFIEGAEGMDGQIKRGWRPQGDNVKDGETT